MTTALDSFKLHTPVGCERDMRLPEMLRIPEPCGYVGALESFVPNLSGFHNAIRCPKCGSTQNVYNRIHSHLISEAVRR